MEKYPGKISVALLSSHAPERPLLDGKRNPAAAVKERLLRTRADGVPLTFGLSAAARKGERGPQLLVKVANKNSSRLVRQRRTEVHGGDSRTGGERQRRLVHVARRMLAGFAVTRRRAIDDGSSRWGWRSFTTRGLVLDGRWSPEFAAGLRWREGCKSPAENGSSRRRIAQGLSASGFFATGDGRGMMATG
ncbi:tRNA(Ile)-lysidine synthase [Striga asiatica]|uniref:tRNA(Ile)-lysidine synthase n=1 Tax=Striga asiatica TaxID=4170 RepID=A0A5A7Q410_STRAF|nr:tRNA(Ile)-lysidine synthase [Striga asiatica]